MTTPATRPVRTPAWELTVAGRNITRAIAPAVLSVSYTDYLHGQTDELEIQIEDRDLRWQSAWYPLKGTRVVLRIGYAGERLLPCGQFEVDEIASAGPPDTVTLRCLAAAITQPLRTERTKGYEGLTLAELAQSVARAHELTVVGAIRPIRLDRVTQARERDLAFLTRIAGTYGYAFSVRGSQLVFVDRAALDRARPVRRLGRRDLARYELRDKAHSIYRACEVTYHDPVTNAEVRHEVTAGGVATGDILKIQARVENREQAAARAEAALRKANRSEAAGTVALSGDPRLVAGVNVGLIDFGQLAGTYQIETSRHQVLRDAGYTTECEVKRVSR